MNAEEPKREDYSNARPAVLPQGEEMELVFHDELDGKTLNASVWKSVGYGEAGIKNETVRGPENLEVKDGCLLLNVRKEAREYNGKKSKWTAASVYSREPLENNVYVETRFKPTPASGVNNAFWLSTVTEKRESFRNRYEVDAPETRKDISKRENEGSAHLDWHDWKTTAYIVDAKGAPAHIAQGIHVEHSWNDFHIWGLWLGENDMIYYLDGKEVWRGKTHEKYTQQWKSGVGKFPKWYPNEERRAYGKFGQEDWSYSGGYSGDRMNILFSTMPWGIKTSPLTDEADGTFMAVDYVRVFKPKRMLSRQPSLSLDFSKPNESLGFTGNVHVDDSGKLLLTARSSAKVNLRKEVSDAPRYYSLTVRKQGTSSLRWLFQDAVGNPMFQAGVDTGNALLAGFSKAARTDLAYPAKEMKQPSFTDGEDYLLVVRITPGKDGEKSAISCSAFHLPMASEKEPYFYRNIDLQGNTSVNNGWMISQKDRFTGSPARVTIENEGAGNVLIGTFKAGPSYLSVLPSAPSPK